MGELSSLGRELTLIRSQDLDAECDIIALESEDSEGMVQCRRSKELTEGYISKKEGWHL